VLDAEDVTAHRIAVAEPRFGVEVDEGTIPQETGLVAESVSFTKGCYLGQEVHARLHYRGHVNRKLMGFELPEAAARVLAPGAALHVPGGGAAAALDKPGEHGEPGEHGGDGGAGQAAEGQGARGGPAGRVTSLARLAVDGARRGIAMVRYPSSGLPAVLAAAPGGPAEVRLFSLPSDLGAGRG
jgi:folate-binding protein YgfZ